MKIAVTFYIILLGIVNTVLCQSSIESSCKELEVIAFESQYDYESVNTQLERTLAVIKSSSQMDLKNCNCADSMWVANLNDMRNHSKSSHPDYKDPVSNLRRLAIQLDIEILEKELEFLNLNSLEDSLEYVIVRHDDKVNKRNKPAYNWMNYYHCIDAEVKFLKDNRYQLKRQYFEIFDDVQSSEELRDVILISYFNSDSSIEEDILIRLNSYVNQQYFQRMLGILGTSGTSESVEYLTNLLKEKEFDINNTKSILMSIYGISDRMKIKRNVKKEFEKYLIETKLDTLSRYDLFIREN